MVDYFVDLSFITGSQALCNDQLSTAIMFEKTLASIFFSGEKILIAELDSGKKNVKKVASIDLPNGVILKNKVADKQKLAEVLTSIWNKNSIRAKDVGLIIPEFSTFTKLITLPKLPIGELGEAVSWQAQEYLPTGTSDMVLDWKILGRSDTATEVLMVAVQKSILMDFADATVLAGLFPIAVETPSISIGKIINCENGYVALIVGAGEMLVVSGEKNKILSTSVAEKLKDNDVVASIAKIMKHYDKVSFKNIYIGGEAINNDFVQTLKNNLKVEVSVLNPSVKGLEPIDVQKYLIPISMLKKPVSEPLDPSTINLLPGSLVDKYQKQKNRTQVWSLTLTITVFVWVSFLVVLGTYMVITQQIATLKLYSQTYDQIIEERKTAEVQANRINKVVSDILNIKTATVFPESVLNKIFVAKPSGVALVSYDLDLDKGIIALRGTSVDRQSLVEFKENLEKVEDFGAVNIPISSFEEVVDLLFTINFIYIPLQQEPTPSVRK